MEATAGRQVVDFGKAGQVGARLRIPGAAADQLINAAADLLAAWRPA